jgi:hypothetical protein
MKLFRIVCEATMAAIVGLAIIGKILLPAFWMEPITAITLGLESAAIVLFFWGRRRVSCLMLMAIAFGGLFLALQDRSQSCGCFGRLFDLDWRTHLFLAALLGLLAAIIYYLDGAS